ncbi:MAG: translation elongation factor Ts [Candidatus Kapaibacterium sp.]
MANITPQMVKELRERTGAGMGDCKKALTEAEGNMDLAIEILRKKGAASAAKRAERAANEGLVSTKVSPDGKTAVMVEVNCETDFVAKNIEFSNYVDQVAEAVLANAVENVDDVMKLSHGSDTIEGMHNEILAKFSEKIEIRRFVKINTEGHISDYVHAGSKLGVLLEAAVSDPGDDVKFMLKDIAMQVAAMSPQYLYREEVTGDTLEKEKEIYIQQAVDTGKKPEIAEKIAQGKIEKFYSENCLYEQAFIKDPKKTIKDFVKDISDKAGKEVKLVQFKRYFIGESED